MYSFVVSLHVLSASVFLIAHGVSIVVFLLLRRNPSVERTRRLLSMRHTAAPVMMIAFGVMVLAGLTAAFMGNWWNRGWTWASLGILIALFLVMGMLGRGYFERVEALFQPAKRAQLQLATALHTQELTPVLQSGRRGVLSVVGIGGLAAILYLMLNKPF